MSTHEPSETLEAQRPHDRTSRLSLLWAAGVMLLLIVALVVTAGPLHITPIALIAFPIVILSAAALILMLLVIYANLACPPLAEPAGEGLHFATIQERLMSNISHELRTPLNVVMGFSEMLGDGVLGELTERQVEAARECHEGGHRILRIVTDIIDVGRARSYAMSPSPQPLDLADFVERVSLLLAGQTRAAHVSLDADVPDDLPAIDADERRFKQLLYHLLITSMARSEPEQTVSLAAGLEGEVVRVTVTDRGEPISEAEVAAALEQAPETIADEGAPAPNAMGLPLCAALAEAMGGPLSITSGLEATTFSFEVPLAETFG